MGQIGAAVLSGPGEGGMGVSRGYHNKPEKNAEAFVPNPFNPADPSDRLYRTGDVVRMLDTGDLEFLGREDHQINLRGYRIEAGEIESALREHESVTEAVVVPRKDTAGSLTLVAFHTGSEVPAAALRDHLAKRLPEYMIPAHFVIMEAVPTPSFDQALQGQASGLQVLSSSGEPGAVRLPV